MTLAFLCSKGRGWGGRSQPPTLTPHSADKPRTLAEKNILPRRGTAPRGRREQRTRRRISRNRMRIDADQCLWSPKEGKPRPLNRQHKGAPHTSENCRELVLSQPVAVSSHQEGAGGQGGLAGFVVLAGPVQGMGALSAVEQLIRRRGPRAASQMEPLAQSRSWPCLPPGVAP